VGRLKLDAVQFERIVERALADHQLAVQARRIQTDLRLEPVLLRADEDKLLAIVTNLVSNAIKYSPDGGMISLALRREGDQVVFEVGDAGPGIPPEDRERVFDWFYQGQPPYHGRVRGSGLGLAIAKEFVLAHGGWIEVADHPSAGAHFRVTLPLLAPHPDP
jgi:two-component system, NtrC family, sensor histidine kinase GlrK